MPLVTSARPVQFLENRKSQNMVHKAPEANNSKSAKNVPLAFVNDRCPLGNPKKNKRKKKGCRGH